MFLTSRWLKPSGLGDIDNILLLEPSWLFRRRDLSCCCWECWSRQPHQQAEPVQQNHTPKASSWWSTYQKSYQLIIPLDLTDFLMQALNPGTNSNTLGSFNLITRKHPYFNPSHPKPFNSVGNLILQPILYPSNPHQLHLILQHLHNFLHFNMSIFQQIRSLLIFPMPLLILLGLELFLCDDQCS